MQSFYEENNDGWLYNKYGCIRQTRELLDTESCYESCYSLIRLSFSFSLPLL